MTTVLVKYEAARAALQNPRRHSLLGNVKPDSARPTTR
jgi:hypothetical protein